MCIFTKTVYWTCALDEKWKVVCVCRFLNMRCRIWNYTHGICYLKLVLIFRTICYKWCSFHALVYGNSFNLIEFNFELDLIYVLFYKYIAHSLELYVEKGYLAYKHVFWILLSFASVELYMVFNLHPVFVNVYSSQCTIKQFLMGKKHYYYPWSPIFHS